MKMRAFKTWFLATVVIVSVLGLFSAGPASATLILDFSDLSSGDTDPSLLTAEVSFTVSTVSVIESELEIDIVNTSNNNNTSEYYSIAQLYFNSDVELTELDFDGDVNPAWCISGTGASQDQHGDGFGKFNWLIDFGSGSNRLGPGLTELTLDMMTGTTSEATIGNKWSVIPPGQHEVIAALKFEAGPNDDSDFGAVVPEPATMLLLGTGLIGLAGIGRKKIFR